MYVCNIMMYASNICIRIMYAKYYAYECVSECVRMYCDCVYHLFDQAAQGGSEIIIAPIQSTGIGADKQQAAGKRKPQPDRNSESQCPNTFTLQRLLF